MGDKYSVRQENDIWGNSKTVIKRDVTAADVGGAIGMGVGLLVAANRNAAMKAALNNAQAAQKHVENGNFDQAIAPANSLIGTSDKEAQMLGHYFKAAALTGLERYDEAIKEYGIAIDIARSVNQMAAAAAAFIHRGMCYYEKDDLGAAMRDFTSYIQFEPNEDAGYYWQGLALLALGDLDQALTNLTRAISINPGDGANYRARADVYARRNEPTKAVEDLTRAITLNPEDAACYGRRAKLYAGLNDHPRALADYSRAIELAPDNLENYKGRAAVHQRTGDATRSAADMAQVAHEEPLQETYREYLNAANTAYNGGITTIYTEADTLTQPKWGLAVMWAILTIVGGVVAMSLCASLTYNSYSGSSSGGASWLILLGMIIIVWAVIAGTRSQAANKVKASTAYLQMRAANEPRMPGFEEFFAQFLQAKKQSRLPDLLALTRPFFQSGPGNRAVQAYVARSQTRTP